MAELPHKQLVLLLLAALFSFYQVNKSFVNRQKLHEVVDSELEQVEHLLQRLARKNGTKVEFMTVLGTTRTGKFRSLLVILPVSFL